MKWHFTFLFQPLIELGCPFYARRLARPTFAGITFFIGRPSTAGVASPSLLLRSPLILLGETYF